MQFYYGFESNYADITSIVYSKCIQDGIVYIPADDNVRAKLFGDPFYGILKHIKTVDSSGNIKIYSSSEAIQSETEVHTLYKTFNRDERRIWWETYGKKIEDINTRLIELQKTLRLNHGDFIEEFPEQLMIMRYLESTDKVLEIGANIGRSGCIIASILDDDRNFLTLECNKDFYQKVCENRNLNGMNFHIEPSALSKQNIIQRGIFTYVSNNVPEGYVKVDTITWNELREKYPINFNVLVADCEGALYHILKDEPDFLNIFDKVITENDYRRIEEYQFVKDKLFDNHFENVFTQSGGWGCCYSTFYQVWIKKHIHNT